MNKKYGTLIKEIRAAHGENMGMMAEWLQVRLPFVSAVENGRKKIPDDWLGKISEHYQLTEQERRELSEAIDLTKDQIKINLAHISDNGKRAAFCLQRSIKTMNDDTAVKIIELLGNDH